MQFFQNWFLSFSLILLSRSRYYFVHPHTRTLLFFLQQQSQIRISIVSIICKSALFPLGMITNLFPLWHDSLSNNNLKQVFQRPSIHHFHAILQNTFRTLYRIPKNNPMWNAHKMLIYSYVCMYVYTCHFVENNPSTVHDYYHK